MSTESEALKACLINPFDTGPRGPYADYLMECGEDDWARERGEFINWHIRFQAEHKGKTVMSQAARDERNEWSEKIWYLYSGRLPMLRYQANRMRWEDSAVAEIHVGIHGGGVVIIRNGMPEKVIMTCEQFMGPLVNGRTCPKCNNTGFINYREIPPADFRTFAEEVAPSIKNIYQTMRASCDECFGGYATDIVTRWPLTEVQFTGPMDRVRDIANRCWRFGEVVVDERALFLTRRGVSERNLSTAFQKEFSQAAVNGMRGWAGLPKLKWPEPPQRPRDLKDAIDAARLAYDWGHAMRSPLELHGLLNDID